MSCTPRTKIRQRNQSSPVEAKNINFPIETHTAPHGPLSACGKKEKKTFKNIYIKKIKLKKN